MVKLTTSEVSYCALHLQRINLKPTFRAVTLGVWGTSEEALSMDYGRLDTATKGRPSVHAADAAFA